MKHLPIGTMVRVDLNRHPLTKESAAAANPNYTVGLVCEPGDILSGSPTQYVVRIKDRFGEDVPVKYQYKELFYLATLVPLGAPIRMQVPSDGDTEVFEDRWSDVQV